MPSKRELELQNLIATMVSGMKIRDDEIAELKARVEELEAELALADKIDINEIKVHLMNAVEEVINESNIRSKTLHKKTASKHDRVRAEFTRLTEVEGLKEKAAIKQLQTWVNDENINSGGYDEPYLKGKILGLK